MLFPTAQRPRTLIEPLLDPGKELENTLHIFEDPVAVIALEGADLQVLPHAHAFEESPIFGNHRDAALNNRLRSQPADLFSSEYDFAVGGHHIPEDGLQGGRLAAGIPAEQADDFARIDNDINLAEDLNWPVVRIDLPELEHRLDIFATVYSHAASAVFLPR